MLQSEPLAVFTIPSLSTAWNKIAVKVEGSTVKLFINCELVDSASVARPQRIEFDPASSFYIGQGGAKYKKPWEGVIQVKYKPNPLPSPLHQASKQFIVPNLISPT